MFKAHDNASPVWQSEVGMQNNGYYWERDGKEIEGPYFCGHWIRALGHVASRYQYT